MLKLRQQNSNSHPLPIFMGSNAAGVTGLGSNVAVTLCKDMTGSFAAALGAVTEIGSGWYALAGNATDRNTVGPLALHATGAGCDPTDELFCITQYDPFAIFDTNSRGTTGNFAGNATNGLLSTNFVAAPGTAAIQGAILTTTNTISTNSDNSVNLNSSMVAPIVQTGLNNQGYTTTRAPYLDQIPGIVTNTAGAILLTPANKLYTDGTGRTKTLDSGGNTFIYAAPLSDQQVENAVLNAASTNHATAGSIGSLIGTGGGGGGASADQIWAYSGSNGRTLTTTAIPAPSSNQCNVLVTCLDPTGAARPRAIVEYQTSSAGTSTTGLALSGQWNQAQSDATGLAQCLVRINVPYVYRVDAGTASAPYTATASGTVNLPFDLVGRTN